MSIHVDQTTQQPSTAWRIFKWLLIVAGALVALILLIVVGGERP
jgi:hypothetical protein